MLSKQEKEVQVNGLTQLVTGIRLFNQALGKGGAGIEDCTSSTNSLQFSIAYLLICERIF